MEQNQSMERARKQDDNRKNGKKWEAKHHQATWTASKMLVRKLDIAGE